MYSDGLGVKIGIAIGFLAFAGMVLLALSATRPSDSPMPGADSWDKIYDKYVTVEIENAFDQVLVDSLEAYRLLCDLNQHKATRLQWSIALFGIQLAGLLLLALAS
jgi:hypothetical protein